MVSPSHSLPLFSTLSFLQDRPTPGQRPFAIRPPSIHHEFSPDPVAQVSSDSTLGPHRLSSFLGSWRTPSGQKALWGGKWRTPLPPSEPLSLCLVKRLRDDLFSRLDSRQPFAMGSSQSVPLSLGLHKMKLQTSILDRSQGS